MNTDSAPAPTTEVAVSTGFQRIIRAQESELERARDCIEKLRVLVWNASPLSYQRNVEKIIHDCHCDR